jgi:hypothetical protein
VSLLLLIDAVIVLTVVEGVVLAVWHRRTGRGLAPGDFAWGLAAGVALMLALRAALAGAGWGAVLGAFGLSGLLHAADLRRRWRR